MAVRDNGRRRKREWLTKLKLATGCSSCGWKVRTARQARQLHFHHRDPRTKCFNVSHGPRLVGWADLKAEVDKCDILCEDCHRDNKYHGRNHRHERELAYA